MHRHVAGALLLTLVAGCGNVSRFGRALSGNAVTFVQRPRTPVHKTRDARRPDARIAVVWIGHATTLVQMDDRFLLTDPVFTPTVGQLSRRLVAPGMDAADLPPIDAVVISHMHFDHLSLGSLDLVAPKVRGALVVPEDGLVYVPNYPISMTDLPWWRSVDVGGGMIVTAVPVDHLGFRYGVDGAWMTKSFSGYVVQYHGLTVYFGGDTAYDEVAFRATRKRFPSIDVALLPIAPIEPREFMKKVHMDGVEAVRAFRDLGARRMVPIHFDTFLNSGDDVGDAERLLRTAATAAGLADGELQVLAIGEERVIVPR